MSVIVYCLFNFIGILILCWHAQKLTGTSKTTLRYRKFCHHSLSFLFRFVSLPPIRLICTNNKRVKITVVQSIVTGRRIAGEKEEGDADLVPVHSLSPDILSVCLVLPWPLCVVVVISSRQRSIVC